MKSSSCEIRTLADRWNFAAARSFHVRDKGKGEIAMTVIIDKNSGNGGGGGMGIMGFILGAVMLAVAVVGFLMWDNYKSGGAPKAIIVTGQSK
jgi:hypothetical protein